MNKLIILITSLLISTFGFAEEAVTSQNIQSNQNAYKIISALEGGTSGLVDQTINAASSNINSQTVGIAKSYLEKLFPTVELQLNMFDLNKTQSGILILSPLYESEDKKHTFFTQDSIYHQDNRTTLNMGLGYRRLAMDNKLLLGINGFYDYEFPYQNSRASIGLEARSTLGELNFNQYWGTSGWKNASNGLQERSLGGADIEAGVPLPYMNWAKFYFREFVWYGVDGTHNLNGNDVSLRAQVPSLQGLAIEVGHRSYTNSTPGENFLRLSYNVIDLMNIKPALPWFSENAYNLGTMEDHRYEKVRRENKIVKATRSKNNFATIKIGGY